MIHKRKPYTIGLLAAKSDISISKNKVHFTFVTIFTTGV